MASYQQQQATVRIDNVGILEGHKGWITQIATTRAHEDILLSSSRDKSIIMWRINQDGGKLGTAQKSLRGHGHFVSDVMFSSDGNFALSGSWDNTLRLWDLKTGKTTRRFVDHKKDVMGVSLSSDNRQIVSCSRDKTIKLWNTLGQCKYTISEDCNDWISCVRFSPDPNVPLVVSCGWDKTVRVWNLKNCRLRVSHYGHSGYLNVVAVSPDGSLCASGGRDGKAILWDLVENKYVHSLKVSEAINALCFSPKRYWLCVAAGSFIRIYDLEKRTQTHADLKPSASMGETGNIDQDDEMQHMNPTAEDDSGSNIECTSMAWSPSGVYLYAGYTDGKIRVWKVFDN